MTAGCVVIGGTSIPHCDSVREDVWWGRGGGKPDMTHVLVGSRTFEKDDIAEMT